MKKVYDAIMGLIVGDALGVPYEFKQRDSFKCEDMVGYGTHNQPKGTWSDDSSMTLATMESITRIGRINLDDIMGNFISWYKNGKFTPYGKCFDIGYGTRCALENYESGMSVYTCGNYSEQNNGNGCLMRILPFAFYKAPYFEFDNVCGLTHPHIVSVVGCKIYVNIARALLDGIDLYSAISIERYKMSTIRRIYYKNLGSGLKVIDRDKVKSTGYVVDTLEAALWCLLNTDNYKDAVLLAVNLGGDTDTIAAVVGGLAGIMYGVEQIPEEWVKQIPRKNWISKLCYDFESLVSK